MTKLKIPIKTILNQSNFTPDFFLAKSGVCFKDHEGNNIRVNGFGFNRDKIKATKSSQFEVLEHLYALYSFQKKALSCKESFTAYSWVNKNENKIFKTSEVLIGPFPYEVDKSADANGLGCHTIYNQAIDHSIFELIERHLLALVWYENELVVEIKNEKNIINNRFNIFHYTLFSKQIPFVITILSDLEKGIWILGSALRHSFAEAMEHSTNEALMLLESTFTENGNSYSEDSKKRLKLLRDKEFCLIRNEFFLKKNNGRKNFDLYHQYNTDEIVNQVLDEKSIWIIDLFINDSFSIVRALCTESKNPRWLRRLTNQSHIPIDPLC